MVAVDINQASQLLLASKIIAVPAETVYGLGAVSSYKYAVEKIFKAKNRSRDNSIICNFSDKNQILKYVKTPHP